MRLRERGGPPLRPGPLAVLCGSFWRENPATIDHSGRDLREPGAHYLNLKHSLASGRARAVTFGAKLRSGIYVRPRPASPPYSPASQVPRPCSPVAPWWRGGPAGGRLLMQAASGRRRYLPFGFRRLPASRIAWLVRRTASLALSAIRRCSGNRASRCSASSRRASTSATSHGFKFFWMAFLLFMRCPLASRASHLSDIRSILKPVTRNIRLIEALARMRQSESILSPTVAGPPFGRPGKRLINPSDAR